jgi:hypothetical protein
MSVWTTKQELAACAEFDNYAEARAIAARIAARDGLDSDLVFSDALHVAVALALEDEGMAYTKANAAWMFERICPGEVREILIYRRDHPEDYASLPKAGALEKLTAAQVEAAGAVTKLLAADWLNAMFFSDNFGTA